MKKIFLLSTTFALLLASQAAAQSFSVSGPGGSIPDCPFSPGVWNVQPNWSTFTSSVFVSNPVFSITMVRLDGLNHTFRGDLHFFLHDPVGNRYNVIVRPGFNGVNAGDGGNYQAGTYDIVETGGSPLNQGAVNINGGTYNQFLNTGGGAWTSGTYVINNTPLTSIMGQAGTWTLEIVDWFAADTGALTGWTLQGLVAAPGVTFCEPGLAGVIVCPCGNPPSGPGRGCNNSSGTGGATMTDTGLASLAADTVVFTTTDERPTALTIVLQGDATIPAGVPYGDGIRCVGGHLRRLYVKTAVGGSITAPGVGDPTVSARSAALGDPISAGTQRYYMVYYRDPLIFACPPSPGTATFNSSSARSILWAL